MKSLVVLTGIGIALFGLRLTAQPAVSGDVLRAMQDGAEAMSAGHFSQAVEDYSAVTRSRPDFAGGFLNLGLAQMQADELDKARVSIAESLRLKPGLRGANLFLGVIDYRQNRFEEAEANLSRETRIDPHSAKAWMWLGVCYLAQDKAQAAIAPLDKAYALDPSDVDILYHRGRAYFLVADGSYQAMFKINHDSARVHQVLGEAFAKGFRNQEAINQFELAVKIAPQLPGVHEELADQYWVLGRLDKAAAAYREELRIDPYSAIVKYKLGSLLVMNQDAAGGVKLLEEALRANPSLSDAHYYLGSGFMDLGRKQEAIGQLKLAIAADPTNNRAISSYYKLAQLYRDLHRSDAAEDAMRNFLRMKADVQAHHDELAAEIVRKRGELPVEDPGKTAVAVAQPER